MWKYWHFDYGERFVRVLEFINKLKVDNINFQVTKLHEKYLKNRSSKRIRSLCVSFFSTQETKTIPWNHMRFLVIG